MKPIWKVVGYVGAAIFVSMVLSVSGNFASSGADTDAGWFAELAPAIAAWMFGLGVSVLTFVMHFYACRMTYRRFILDGSDDPSRILWAMISLAAMHVGQMTMWGVAMWIGDEWMHLGEITGDTKGAFIDYLNFSMATYTSLGLGDITPTGWLKVMTGLEALVGLLCIGWSVSMFVGKMGTFLEPRDGS